MKTFYPDDDSPIDRRTPEERRLAREAADVRAREHEAVCADRLRKREIDEAVKKTRDFERNLRIENSIITKVAAVFLALGGVALTLAALGFGLFGGLPVGLAVLAILFGLWQFKPSFWFLHGAVLYLGGYLRFTLLLLAVVSCLVGIGYAVVAHTDHIYKSNAEQAHISSLPAEIPATPEDIDRFSR